MSSYRATAALAVLSDSVLELIERDAEPLAIQRKAGNVLDPRLYIPAKHGLWGMLHLDDTPPDVWLVNRRVVRDIWTDSGVLIPAERPLARVIKSIATVPAEEYVARQRRHVGLEEPSHTLRFDNMVRDRGNLPAEWQVALYAVMHILMPVAT